MRDLDNVIDILAEIDEVSNEMARLALRASLTITIASGAEAERAAESLRGATGAPSNERNDGDLFAHSN